RGLVGTGAECKSKFHLSRSLPVAALKQARHPVAELFFGGRAPGEFGGRLESALSVERGGRGWGQRQSSKCVPFATKLERGDLIKIRHVDGSGCEHCRSIRDKKRVLDQERRAAASQDLGSHLKLANAGHSGFFAAQEKARTYA